MQQGVLVSAVNNTHYGPHMQSQICIANDN